MFTHDGRIGLAVSLLEKQRALSGTFDVSFNKCASGTALTSWDAAQSFGN